MRQTNDDTQLANTLRQALELLDAQHERNRQILVDGIARLDGARVGRPRATEQAQQAPRKKRHISAAGRRAIAEAQRKRWAAVKRSS